MIMYIVKKLGYVNSLSGIVLNSRKSNFLLTIITILKLTTKIMI